MENADGHLNAYSCCLCTFDVYNYWCEQERDVCVCDERNESVTSVCDERNESEMSVWREEREWDVCVCDGSEMSVCDESEMSVCGERNESETSVCNERNKSEMPVCVTRGTRARIRCLCVMRDCWAVDIVARCNVPLSGHSSVSWCRRL